ncbi:MAG: lipoprotein [Candidatus Odyssella sp.]|nr:lipoprotein [Candidatus Odyssella sp.]
MTPIRLFAALAAAAFLAGCGVKGPPEQADNYPRTYPPGAVPHETAPPGLFLPPRYPSR